jgi:tRNA (adenine57-N1/adenine58-N1)-methyltransferase
VRGAGPALSIYPLFPGADARRLSAEPPRFGVTTPVPFCAGEVVLLRHRERDSLLLPVRAGPQTVEGIGVIDLGPAIGKLPGEAMDWAGRRYRLLRPGLSDLLAHLRRRAQIVTPKDAQYLLFLAGVGPGGSVAEAGAGSGALTLVLAHAVGEHGRVVSYDRRPDFLEVARGNLALTPYGERVEFRERDVARDGFGEEGFSSVVLDVPEPWTVLPHARRALAPGGFLGLYTPTYNQLETSVRALRAEKFEEIRSVELLERALHVGEGGTRPEFEMLGHTGFLTGARRIE